MSDEFSGWSPDTSGTPDFGSFSGFLDQLGGDFSGGLGSAVDWSPMSSGAPDYGSFSGFVDNLGDMGASGQAAGSPIPTAASEGPGVWDTLNNIGRQVDSPAGKLVAGGIGGLAGLYGAMKQNSALKDAIAKQQAMVAARQAAAQKYSSPIRLNFGRTAEAAPVARRGESSFFTGNQLPSYFAEGGPVNEDAPSALGFIKYMMNGRKFPSEQREEGIAKVMRTGVPNEHMTREQYLQRLQQMTEEPQREPIERAIGGRSNYVQGGTPGQADKIPAQLSDGEYIMDADVVSALGDGNNAAGAAKLDQMRQGIRTHKRSAPANKIPPKAKSPLAYMKSKGAK